MKFFIGSRTVVGRLGDVIPFNELIDSVKTPGFAFAMGEESNDFAIHEHEEMCGSPNEVATQPSRSFRYAFSQVYHFVPDIFNDNGFYNMEPSRAFDWVWSMPKTSVHAMIAVYSDDQLTQRLAFALSQIWVIGEMGEFTRFVEAGLTWYDILVRHARGNLRNLMKEASYSVWMAMWLSFLNSNSWAYSGTKPDENYAREIMQCVSRSRSVDHWVVVLPCSLAVAFSLS